MTTLIQDLHFALRQLRKTPAFTLTVLLTVALGIGGNTAIFSLVDSILLRNLPVIDPNTLVRIGDKDDCCVNSGVNDTADYSLFSADTYRHLRQALPEFDDLAAMESGFNYRPLTVRRDGPATFARSVMGEFVSGNYFRTFGLQPAAGRLFADSDDTEGAPIPAVLGYSTWQDEYAADPSVIGSTFYVNTRPVTVVGIAPRGFFGDRLSSTPPDVYLPIASVAVIGNVPYLHDPDVDWLYILGRVKPGTALGPLQAKISGLLRQEFAPTKTFQDNRNRPKLAKVHVILTPGGSGIRLLQDFAHDQLHLLMWIAAIVLLVACANIANLLLVRGMGRRAEMSIRAALGGARARIIRQLLTESVLLAVLGGLFGLVVAAAGVRALLALAFPDAHNLPIDATPSLAVFAFAFALSFLTGIVFGVAPAWIAAHAQPADALRSGARTTAAGASLLQRSLVVLQAALSLILIVCAGLFSQSLYKLQSSNLRLDPTNRYIVHINPQAAGYTPTQLEALYRTLEARFHALPGIVDIGISNYTPMEENNWSNTIQIQGQPDLLKNASFIKANAEYLNSVGTHVLQGRGIGIEDTPAAPHVAVVNQAFVKTFFKPGVNPIGQRFGSPGPKSSGDWEIVGVVEDTTYTAVQWKDHSMYFVPITQRFASDTDPIDHDISLYAGALVLHTSHPINDMEKLTRETLASINPNLTVVKFQTFHQQIDDIFIDNRLIARLTSLFGALALLLATLGLYGITAYAVVRRTGEIGIRMALGANRGGIVALFLRGAMIQAAIGLALGIPGALLCARYIRSQLYDITSVNPAILAAAIATLAVSACIAGIIPARRAASIDPVKALRVE